MASLILFQNVLNARLETVLEMDCCATPVEKGPGAEIVEAATVASVTANNLPEPVVRAVLMMGGGWLVGIG